MTPQKNIVVIGGGIIGVSAAYYLSKQGRSVTLIEKGEISAGASAGNAGLIANGFAIPIAAPGVPKQGLKMMLDRSSPFYIKPRLNLDLIGWVWKFVRACNTKQMRASIPVLLALGQGSFDLLDELHETENVNFGYEKKGRLIAFTSDESFEVWKKDAALVQEYGVRTDLLDADGVKQVEPNLLSSVKHGIFCDSYAHVDPDRFTKEMRRLAESHGAEIITGTAVTGFETTRGEISSVNTSQGTFTAKQVILAAGAWSAELARKMKLSLPIQPAKGYSLTYKRPPISPNLPLSLAERKTAVTPMGDILRFTSTLELAGFDPTINQRRIETIRRSVREYLTGIDELDEHSEIEWFGYRPATPDDLPIIGRSEKIENLIFATGHGTLGITHALITGKLVSQITGSEEPALDLEPLRAERF
ncbi:MAG: FAD-dependent oxidoreductase [Anaerolineales bacterium]|nr:FAD-dependent oxidoreductase [Chloroflexota bacterium]MBL6982332.1 FAD-dependent oxidoreductase [Anaerolineales bacterium]